jgi:hypothetical protein
MNSITRFVVFLAFVSALLAVQLKLDVKKLLKGVLKDADSDKFAKFAAKWGKNYKTADELKKKAKI